MINREFRTLLTAVLFYTRIPCPPWVDHSSEFLKASSRYFPFIGILIGGLSGLIFYGARILFDVPISVLLSMTSSILLTGAFHEDGLADMCDGFGGGWTKEKILSIMKDSRIGTFGALGLITTLGLKFLCLNQIAESQFIPVIIAGNSLSRFLALTYLYTHSYARESSKSSDPGQVDDSKIRPLSDKISLSNLLIGGIFGLAPLLLIHQTEMIGVLFILGLVQFLLGRMFTKWIGGFTGDCLGGAQQIGEVVFYLGCLVIFKYPF